MNESVVTPFKKKKEPRFKKRPDLSVSTKFLSIFFTIISTLTYASLYMVLPEYRKLLGRLPEGSYILVSVILNIYQIYLSVFILISIALFIVYYVRTKKFVQKQTVLFALIVFNMIVSILLFGITFIGSSLPT